MHIEGPKQQELASLMEGVSAQMRQLKQQQQSYCSWHACLPAAFMMPHS